MPIDTDAAIIVIDGGWEVGKSTLCQDLCADNPGSILIEEPFNCPHPIRHARADWYLAAHINRLETARGYSACGRRVLMERCLVSTLAYNFDRYSHLCQSILMQHGCASLKHVIVLGDSTQLRNTSETTFGDAVEMRDQVERQLYAERLAYLCRRYLTDVLIIADCYDPAIHWRAVSGFIAT